MNRPDLTAAVPSASLLAHLATQLRRWMPFVDMPPADVEQFLARARQRYLAPGEVLLSPAQGVVSELFLIREGSVAGSGGTLGAPAGGGDFVLEAGELVPVAALLARRAVTATYTALDDVFVLAVPAADVQALAARCAPFADFLNRRVTALLEKSRQALREHHAGLAMAEQSLDTPLARLASHEPVQCSPQTPLRDALRRMHERHVGSILVMDATGELRGILTRHDLLGLVVLDRLRLDAPIADVMNSPVHSLAEDRTAQDAALLMSRHAIRHVPVTRDGRVTGMVSERDLFALQRASLQQVSARIHRASDRAALALAAREIRELARNLLGQGVQARQLTTLISHLNDLLTQRLLEIAARERGIGLDGLCWLALGSEGRGEQTVATDQDNALIVPDTTDDARLEVLREWAAGINRDLDTFGYPLCKGGIMAGEPACCLRESDWAGRFARWIDHGSPQDLLDASIYFDLRALAGDPALARPLVERIRADVARTPRFVHQLTLNALTRRPPLGWRGQVEADAQGGIDLKLQGTALFVDAARILALSSGVTATSTRDRLLGAGAALGVPAREHESWVGAFEFLQNLRLRVQLDPRDAGADPNHLRVDTLSDIDRRILTGSLRAARALQQRLELDHAR